MRRCIAVATFFRDCRGIAAVEFAMIVPLMLVLLFATVEFASGLAIDRKVSLVARTIANLTSQGATASVADLTNYIGAANLIMVPYVQPTYPAPNMTISELYINPTTGNAYVQWSWGSAPRGLQSQFTALPPSMIATDPTTHAILQNQYIIVSEVNTLYTPTFGFFGVMGNSGISLSDIAYALPRQSTCVFYPSVPAIVPPATAPACPTGP
ncbi:TadE/TadG family type IV pilus assembly protein [Bradyrhizobium erythrophlei]|jgi:Flp pilus assembly protein TadG|nr:TadE/TadG family type IV pilus assembly protein [Bradyrhizobium erythrophlei]